MKVHLLSTVALLGLTLANCNHGSPVLEVNMATFTTPPQTNTRWQIPTSADQPLVFQSDPALVEECFNSPEAHGMYNAHGGLVTSALVPLGELPEEAALLQVSLRYHSQLTSPSDDPVSLPPIVAKGFVTLTSPQPQATSDIPLASGSVSGVHEANQVLTLTLPRPASQTLLISLGMDYHCRKDINPKAVQPEQRWHIDSISITSTQ